ncbi:acyl-CoA dehydrogenase family protein [Vibrio splendidus]
MSTTSSLDLSYLDPSLEKFAELGLQIENNPSSIDLLLDDDILMAISHIGIPKEYNPYHNALKTDNFDPDKFPHFLQLVEYIARFDASSMLMMPGNSLSCRAVGSMGTPEQQAHFFSRFLHKPTWTFFAVSEPNAGSDAHQIQTNLTRDGTQNLFLNGKKKFIGGAQKADIGLVFARLGNSHRLVVVEPSSVSAQFKVTPLQTYGLVGTGLSEITMTNVPIEEHQLLGNDELGLRQGMNAISHVFEKHRPLVASMALGTAHALLTQLQRHGCKGLHSYWMRYHAMYQFMLKIGEDFQEKAKVHQTSMLKAKACAFVESVALLAPKLLPTEVWLTSPTLQKRYRDAFAFEYMEGTSNIHRLNAFRSFTTSMGAL